jgi:alkyl hydroperoxide reductase subunit AhpC
MQEQIFQVGQKAPNFTAEAVFNYEFVNISLEDYKGKYVVLFFYPLDFTFVCPTEIIAFSEMVDKFEKVGAKILGVSVDSKFSHLAWINTPRKQGGLGEIKFPLISDITKGISRKYQVLLEEGVTLRGVFIIDPEGVLKVQIVHNNNIGRNIEEILRLVKADKYVSEHPGEVCPVNWTEQKSTMKADVKGSKEYFDVEYK